jgi:hypothetical protein
VVRSPTLPAPTTAHWHATAMTDPISMTGDLRGERALPHLLDPRRIAGDSGERLLVMNHVAAVDAYTGAVVRASIEAHLALGRGARVCVWPPVDPDVWATVHDLLRPLPQGCEFPDDAAHPVRARHVFLPAHRVDDLDYAAVLTRFLRPAGSAAGLNPRETGQLATALPALVDNALRYAPTSPCGVIACGAVERESGDAQLVAVDLGAAVSGSPPNTIRDCVTHSQKTFGGLHNVLRRAEKVGLDVTLTIASGTGRARWRGRWQYREAQFVPGWSVGLSVHPERPPRGTRRV